MGRRGPGAKPTRAGANAAPIEESWKAPGLNRAERVIAFLEALPITKGILAGETMRLLDYQRAFVEAVYGAGEPRPVSLAIQSIPRGNGKTGLLAGLALCHLLGPESEPRGEVYSAALDRQQAGLIYSEMEAIVFAVENFAGRVNCQRFHKRLEVDDGDGAGSVFESLSKDSRRAHGLAPSFWIYDELAQAKDRELLDNLLTAQGKRRESLGVVISTQAHDDKHPLSQLIDGEDPDVHVQCIAAPIDADPFDIENLRAVNPALGHFLDEKALVRDMVRAEKMPSFEAAFRNLRLNQRIAQEAAFISEPVFRACARQPDEVAFRSGDVWVGLDLSTVRDMTALVYAAKRDGEWHVRAEFYTPREGLLERAHLAHADYATWEKQGFLITTDGRTVDYSVIAERLAELCTDYTVAALAIDPWKHDVLTREVARLGLELPIERFGQSFKWMSSALDVTETGFVDERIRHGGNPILAWHFRNAVVRADEHDNRKLVKQVSHGKIDGAVALAMALGQAAKQPEREQPRHVTGRLVVL